MKFSLASILLVATLQTANGFAPSLMIPNHPISKQSSTSKMKSLTLFSSNDEKSAMDIMTMKVDIPEEVRDEIFRAEANTPAAKDRNQRMALYAAMALIGIGFSSFNVFLSSVRAEAGGAATDLSSIEELGFGWVGSNPITSFLLLNGIGGGISLIAAGFGGTMLELENRTKNENAEKIWKELQRRRSVSEGGSKQRKAAPAKKKKNKNKKRLSALSEVILEDERKTVVENNVEAEGASESAQEGGLMDKMKDFYKKADDMAASQALLLNKELEDRGVVEKITDETGLKVIGKEAASKLSDKKEE